MRGGSGEAVDLGQMLLARQHQFGRGQRIGKFSRLLGHLERIEAGDADREHDREPDAEQIDRRQHQRVFAVPRQRQMEEHQRRGAGDREQAERDRHPDRQRRRRDQDRAEKQERERILQAAGQEQQRGQFDDVEREQRRRIDRFQPLHRVEGDLQREIEQRREADDGDAGNDGKVEFQPLRHDEDRGELAERRQPAQPENRIQTDIAVRKAEIGGCDVGHCGSLAVWGRDHKFARSLGFAVMAGLSWFEDARSLRLAHVRHATSFSDLSSGGASAVSKDEARLLPGRSLALTRPDGPMNGPEMVNSDAMPAQSAAAGPESSAAIDVAHLVKLYKTTRAVDDVSFRIARGSITGLLGGNGAGKTTTIAMIMGLVLPTSGRIQVLGHAMPEQSAEVLGRMNFESPYVDMPMRLTVRQNLTIFGRLYAVKNLAARIEQLASDLDLKDFLDRANGKLSAGQKTRVALAKALINQPELLLLDEPTASLDPDTADWVRQHLEDYRRTHDATILLASHNMLEVERLCDRVIIMKRGRIEDDDSPDQIMARYNRDHAGRGVPRRRARAAAEGAS